MNEKIELARLLLELGARPIIDAEYYEIRAKLISSYSGDKGQLADAEKGLEQEKIFALLCRLMGTATSITPLSQLPIVKGDEIAVDLAAGFRPNCTIAGLTNEKFTDFTCLIEVKSTRKHSFRYTGAGLRRRRNFAKRFGLPLFFAVRFMTFANAAIWVLVQDDPQKPDLVAEVGALAGPRTVLWDDFWLMRNPNYLVETDFVPVDGTGSLLSTPHGYMKRIRFRSSGHTVEVEGMDAGLYWILALTFNPSLGESLRIAEGTRLTSVMQDNMHSIADIVFGFNWLPWQGGFGPRTTVQLEAKVDGETIADRDFVLTLLDPLLNLSQPVEKRAFWIMGMGDPEKHVEAWKRFGQVT